MLLLPLIFTKVIYSICDIIINIKSLITSVELDGKSQMERVRWKESDGKSQMASDMSYG